MSTPPSTGSSGTAEETGVVGVQARLLDGFRTAGAKVVYTLVTYQPGLPGIKPNSPLFRTLVDCNCLLEGTPAVEVIDGVAPRPGEPLVRGQRANGFDRTELDTILRVAGVDTVVLAGIATDVAVEQRKACRLWRRARCPAARTRHGGRSSMDSARVTGGR